MVLIRVTGLPFKNWINKAQSICFNIFFAVITNENELLPDKAAHKEG